MPRDTSHDVEMSTTSSGMKRSDLGGSAPLDRRELQTPSSSRGALDRPPSSSKRTKGDPTPDTLAIAKSKAVQPSRPESNAAPGIAANSPATLGPTLSEAAQKRLKKRERKKLKKRQQALNNADVAGDAAAGETAVDAGLGDADRGAGTSGSDPTPAVVQSEDATDAQRPLAAADPPPPAVPTLSAGFKNMKVLAIPSDPVPRHHANLNALIAGRSLHAHFTNAMQVSVSSYWGQHCEFRPYSGRHIIRR